MPGVCILVRGACRAWHRYEGWVFDGAPEWEAMTPRVRATDYSVCTRGCSRQWQPHLRKDLSLSRLPNQVYFFFWERFGFLTSWTNDLNSWWTRRPIPISRCFLSPSWWSELCWWLGERPAGTPQHPSPTEEAFLSAEGWSGGLERSEGWRRLGEYLLGLWTLCHGQWPKLWRAAYALDISKKDWGQEEKGTTEDEMAGWHHWLNGHGFGWTPGGGDVQRGLACWGSWGRKESDMTEWLNWTELKIENTPAINILALLEMYITWS